MYRFQPKVDINTRHIRGAEALAGWRTKDGRIVPTNEFIPICEKTGLITAVDKTIFEQTLKLIRRCLDDGGPVHLYLSIFQEYISLTANLLMNYLKK